MDFNLQEALETSLLKLFICVAVSLVISLCFSEG